MGEIVFLLQSVSSLASVNEEYTIREIIISLLTIKNIQKLQTVYGHSLLTWFTSKRFLCSITRKVL